MQSFTWKCCDQKTGAQLATVVGGGWGWAEVQILPCRPSWGIKSGSCPVADLFKACADVLIPPTHTCTYTRTCTLTIPPDTHTYLPSSNSLLTPQPKQDSQLTFLITSALTLLSPWYLFSAHHSFFFIPLTCLWSREGSIMVSAVLWQPPTWSDFLNELSQTLSILCSPLVPVSLEKKKKLRSSGTSNETGWAILNLTSQRK